MPARMSCFPSWQVRLSRQPEAVTGQFTNAAIVRLRSRARQNGRLLTLFWRTLPYRPMSGEQINSVTTERLNSSGETGDDPRGQYRGSVAASVEYVCGA